MGAVQNVDNGRLDVDNGEKLTCRGRLIPAGAHDNARSTNNLRPADRTAAAGTPVTDTPRFDRPSSDEMETVLL